MQTHFNIAQKQAVNPFEPIKYFTICDIAVNSSTEALKKLVNDKAETAEAAKRNGRWVMLFPLSCLDYVTIIRWYDERRGTFTLGQRQIQFRLADDVMICW